MNEIEIAGLTKRFGGFAAVRDLTLSVAGGTIFGFLGPNGSGKSTTVKMLTGMLRPTAGDAFIGGKSILTSATEIKRGIGVLPEEQALFDALTVREHLSLAGPVYGLSRAETERRADQLLSYLDLCEHERTYVGQASYGTRKKCALALALLHAPRVLFLDEPFEGLDPASSRSVKDLLVRLARGGTTVFLTSHILEVVERLVESFAVVVRGEVVCRRTVADVAAEGLTLEDVYFRHVPRPTLEELEWLG